MQRRRNQLSISRRPLLAGLGAMSIGFAAPAIATAKPRVVVIGAGAGGATTANLLGRLGQGRLEIDLISTAEVYTSPFFSNLALTGMADIGSLMHTPRDLIRWNGVKHVTGRVAAVDPEKRVVRLAGGGDIPYDFLVASPGVEMRPERLPGYNEGAFPHAWDGGKSLRTLMAQLFAMEDGGVFAIATPPYPYRCPPAAYERACLVAGYFKREKPNSRVLILDAASGFAMQGLFEAAWADEYDGMVEWIPADMHGGITSVDAEAKSMETDFDTFEADVANIIPPQTAPRFLLEAGFGNEQGYCPVDGRTMTAKSNSSVYIVGDASEPGDVARSASAAVSQAGLAARAILKTALGDSHDGEDLTAICWSRLAVQDAISLYERYETDGDKLVTADRVISSPEDDAATRLGNVRKSISWYDGIIKSMYGGT